MSYVLRFNFIEFVLKFEINQLDLLYLFIIDFFLFEVNTLILNNCLNQIWKFIPAFTDIPNLWKVNIKISRLFFYICQIKAWDRQITIFNYYFWSLEFPVLHRIYLFWILLNKKIKTRIVWSHHLFTINCLWKNHWKFTHLINFLNFKIYQLSNILRNSFRFGKSMIIF